MYRAVDLSSRSHGYIPGTLVQVTIMRGVNKYSITCSLFFHFLVQALGTNSHPQLPGAVPLPAKLVLCPVLSFTPLLVDSLSVILSWASIATQRALSNPDITRIFLFAYTRTVILHCCVHHLECPEMTVWFEYCLAGLFSEFALFYHIIRLPLLMAKMKATKPSQ